MQKLYGHVKITGDNLKLLEWKSASNGEAHFASSEKALKNLEMTLLEILGQDKNHLDLSRRMEKNGLVGKCRIIYTPFANQCSSLVAAVEDRLGIECAAFHRSMSRVEKKRVLDAFMGDRIKVIVVTSAFGTGMDKRNVRFVHHVNMASSILDYV
jgi:superfamily II DNA helicase RecQ